MKPTLKSQPHEKILVETIVGQNFPGATWDDVAAALTAYYESHEPSEQPDRLLKVAEVGKRLGLSTRTVYDMISRGLLPCTKLGNRATRIPESAVNAVIAGGHIPGSLSGKSPARKGRA